ncbi:hypothetical protein H0E87_030638, partial [Populus deltoides]
EVSVEFSVEDLDNNPLHYCHVRKCGVRQLHTQAENDCDFILPYCKRCRDNKRDNEAKLGGSGFKNGAESTTNDFKVYSRRPK